MGEAKLLNEEYTLGFNKQKAKKLIPALPESIKVYELLTIAAEHKLNLRSFLDEEKAESKVFKKFIQDGALKKREFLTLCIMLSSGSASDKADLLSDLYSKDDYVTFNEFSKLYETCADVALELVTEINTIEIADEVQSSINTYLKNLRRFRANGIGALKKNLFVYDTQIPVYLFKACFTKKFTVAVSNIK